MQQLCTALIVGFAVLFSANEGKAAPVFYVTGQSLNEICEEGEQGDHTSKLVCAAYIVGAYDAGDFDIEPLIKKTIFSWRNCMPNDVGQVQLVAVVVSWIRSHPEQWHYGASSLVGRALSETWPCQ